MKLFLVLVFICADRLEISDYLRHLLLIWRCCLMHLGNDTVFNPTRLDGQYHQVHKPHIGYVLFREDVYLDGWLIKAYTNSLNKVYDYIVAYLKYNSLKSPFVTSLTCSPAFTSSVRLSDLSALIWNMRGSTVPLSLFVLDVKLVSGSFFHYLI